MNNDKIDFVILWVDGSDPKWLKSKKKYQPNLNISDSIFRFRDWDNLKYWFRGVEKFAPWVNNIYFVTCGHLPKFLNVSHPKLKIINHKDYIDNKYLPTFNSSAIEINLCNIDSLGEKFVYFNDDTFIIDNVKPKDFFYKGLPKDEYTESAILPQDSVFSHILMNNVYIINKNFNKKEMKKNNFFKIYNLKYGLKNNIKTLSCRFYNKYTGFYNPHLPQAYLKQEFKDLWRLEKDLCERTSQNRFRDTTDITQYAVRYTRLVKGLFYPRSSKFGKYFEIEQNNELALETIKKQKCKMICLNDVRTDFDFDVVKKQIIESFEHILPEKSSFER